MSPMINNSKGWVNNHDLHFHHVYSAVREELVAMEGGFLSNGFFTFFVVIYLDYIFMLYIMVTFCAMNGFHCSIN